MLIRFDYALSFAGPDRAVARRLRTALLDEGFRVFFDEDYEHEMLGQDGIRYLMSIYSRESKHCIVLVSPAYESSEWTNLERETIQARELTGERGVLVPVKLTDHSPSWLSPSRIYFDLSSRPFSDLLKILRAKHLSSSNDLPPRSPVHGARPSIDLSGTWISHESIGKLVSRVGTMSFTHSGEALSGTAILEERHPNGDKVKFELDLHGDISASDQAIRFVGALVRFIAGSSSWPYSVDSFAGRLVDQDTIVGSCVDERGTRGSLHLSRAPREA